MGGKLKYEVWPALNGGCGFAPLVRDGYVRVRN